MKNKTIYYGLMSLSGMCATLAASLVIAEGYPWTAVIIGSIAVGLREFAPVFKSKDIIN